MAVNDVKNESFTRRFLRRAVTNINDSCVPHPTCSRRKLNILQAINNGSYDTTINMSSQQRTVVIPEKKLQPLGTKSDSKLNLKCDKNSLISRENSSANFSARASQKDFELLDNEWKYYNKNSTQCVVDTPRLVKVKCKNVETPRNLQTEFVSTGKVEKSERLESNVSSSKRFLSARQNDEGASVASEKSQVLCKEKNNVATYKTPYASLSEAIKDLERDINKLDLRVDNAFARDKRYNYFTKRQDEYKAHKSNAPSTKEEIKKCHDSEVLSDEISKSKSPNNVDVVKTINEHFNVATNEEKVHESYDKANVSQETEEQQVVSPRYKKHTPPIPAFKPKRSKKMVPNLESTRRSSISEMTKKNTSPCSIQSSISTITAYTSPKLQLDNTEVVENSVPYEVEKFLENALGDEMFNISSTINTTSNPLELAMCQTNDTPIREKMRDIKLPVSDPPLQNTGTLNRTLVFYRSLSQRIKKKLRPRLKEKVKTDDLSVSMPMSKRNDRVQSLLQQLEIQQTLIHQASKALNLCHANKKFICSAQHVESERLLLLTSLKKKAVLEEIKRISASDGNALVLTEKGQINIANITLNLKEGAYFSEKHLDEVSQWFVIIVSQGSTVWATTAVNYSSKVSRIRFPGVVSLPDLTPNFRITVNVYTLRLKGANCDKDGKCHAANSNGTCPSPRSFWKKVEKSQMLKQQLECSSIRETSFKLCGQVELMLHDLSLPSPWPLMGVPLNSVLQGTIDLDLTCRLHISVTHAGFLTHGEESGGYALWNRRWCVLEGYILKFWNYPQECEWKPPLLSIDLSNCTSNEVMLVDRTICAKPRTLVFKTTRKRRPQDQDSLLLECRPSYTIVRNLLSCDTVNDLLTWSSKLNYVLSVLRDWNTTTHMEALITEL